MVSRWGHILVRRVLASRLDAPAGYPPADFAAARAALLVRMGEGEAARALAPNCLLLDEFIDREAAAGRIDASCVTAEAKTIHVHGHCHQKALGAIAPTLRMLSLPANFSVREIPSGCCGMAGSFGFEKEHYEVSMRVGSLVLLPFVRMLEPAALIAASGTSCRHQIHDGSGRSALHPAVILRQAIRPNPETMSFQNLRTGPDCGRGATNSRV